MLVTVFTPVYNRAYIITRLYESLCRQTCKDFEWVVVDDGSNDNIDELIHNFIDEKKIDIHYFKQPNGGKHRAVNHGVREARGDMFFIVDSDDYIPDDAIEFITNKSTDILNNSNFAGIAGIDQTIDGQLLSNMPLGKYIDATALDIRYKYDIKGDMAEVFKTNILRKFPFPEIDGEFFTPEDLIWNRIAAKRIKLRNFPKVLKIVEYLPDGITSSIDIVRMNSPITSTIYYLELSRTDIPIVQKIKATINYWRFAFCHSNSNKPRLEFWRIWALPIGYIMHLNDLRKVKLRP